MIKRDELSTYLINLSRNGWDITYEDNKLIARSPGIADLDNDETYLYRVDLINRTAYKDIYKAGKVIRSEDVSFELIVRKCFRKTINNKEGYVYDQR